MASGSPLRPSTAGARRRTEDPGPRSTAGRGPRPEYAGPPATWSVPSSFRLSEVLLTHDGPMIDFTARLSKGPDRAAADAIRAGDPRAPGGPSHQSGTGAALAIAGTQPNPIADGGRAGRDTGAFRSDRGGGDGKGGGDLAALREEPLTPGDEPDPHPVPRLKGR